jgi:hypothetical protein
MGRLHLMGRSKGALGESKSIFFWAWLLGPVAALLSMPITVLLSLVFRRDESTHSLADIIDRTG